MSRLLNSEAPQDESFGSSALWIGRERHANSAAKFWSSLLDEIVADYPVCDALRMEALTETALSRDLLFPETLLQKDMDVLEHGNFREAMHKAVEELNLYGLPGAVGIRLLSGDREILARELPMDCMDAELFPYMVVWLLEWAGVEPRQWNDETVKGRLAADDRRRQYTLDFALDSIHVSEGLYRRILSVEFSRETLAQP
ncbi:MAG: hypothetical protein HY343_07715 [Lentisphaerae bacterium]|nr:hypothetical protein [Lentisphaerota bacterium]